MAFRGSADYTLDAKNRLTIPARYRAELAGGVVVALRPDVPGCVAIWKPEDFDANTDKLLQGLHPLSEDYNAINDFCNANSLDTELDSAGRVMIPAKMLGEAGLARDVTVNGAGNRLEIWSREAASAENAKNRALIKQVQAKLGNAA